MRMKRIVGVLVAGMVLAGPSQVALAQSSNTEVLAFRGFNATAVFDTTEGCIFTRVIVGASETSAAGQPTGKQDFAGVNLDRRNTCTGEVLVSGGGSGPDVNVDIAPNFRSAEVHGVVPVHDAVSDRTFDVAVDVVWTGSGEIERNAVQYSFEDDGVVVRVHQNGSARHATAVGHVVGDSTEWVPAGTVGDGLIVFSNEGQVLINLGA
jgi:hypothetical protein